MTWQITRDPKGQMKYSIRNLIKHRIHAQEVDGLAQSPTRFAPGSRYKIRTASFEGLATFKTVIDVAIQHRLVIYSIRQGW